MNEDPVAQAKQAAFVMRHLSLEDRNRMIHEAGSKVFDARALFAMRGLVER